MAAYAPVDRNEELEAHLVPRLGRIEAELIDDLHIRPRCSILCALLSCFALGLYALASWNTLQFEKHLSLIGNYTDPLSSPSDGTPMPISTDAEVSERFALALSSEIGSFLLCMIILAWWKLHSNIPITWSMLCYFVFRGCTLGAVVAVMLEAWGINMKMAGGGHSHSTLRVACTMFVVGLAEETGKMFALSFNLARHLEEVGAPNGCCRLFRTLVENPKSMIIAGVATGYGFMILENFEYFFINAVSPDLAGPHDDPKTVALFGDFSRVYTAVTRNIFNPHPLFTGLAAGYMCDYYYGPYVISMGGTLGFGNWCAILGVSVLLHAWFDFMVTMLGDWANDGLTYVLLTLLLQLFSCFLSLMLLVRQWRKVAAYTR